MQSSEGIIVTGTIITVIVMLWELTGQEEDGQEIKPVHILITQVSGKRRVLYPRRQIVS